ncbi:acyl-CoA dehydrogenase [Aliihoeflea sp. PC F10.4]
MNWTVANRRDVDFLLYEVLDTPKLFEHARFAHHDRQTVDGAIDLAFDIATNILWKNARAADLEEPRLVDGRVVISPATKEGVNAIVDAGFIAASGTLEDGGLQLPMVVTQACLGVLKGADCATAGYVMLTRAAANLLRAHGDDIQRRTFMAPMMEGRFFGTMCLSEPDVGSSLGDIRTMATPFDDGTYRIRGNKMWISGADQDISQNVIHLVLAKLPDAPAGAGGLSLFIVPRNHVNDDGTVGAANDVRVAGLNHKLGYRATSNCALNFGENGTCVGYLVGQPHKGLLYMFHMMNEARVGVGTGAAMAGYAGYGEAVRYARERIQGRPLGAPAGSKPVEIVNHPDVKRMLLRQKAFVEGALALCLFGAFLIDESQGEGDDEERQIKAQILDVLTPIIKSWPSEFCLEANKDAIQVHGGAGYTRDFIVEKLYRDNRLNAIHEGTTGIQAQDFLGRKVRMEGGVPYRRVLDAIRSELALHETLDVSKRQAAQLERALASVEDVISLMVDKQAAGDVRGALSNATNVLLAFGHIVIGWLWLWQTRVAQASLSSAEHDDRLFYEGKLAAMTFYFAFEVPLVEGLLQPVRDGETVCDTVSPDCL